MRVADAGPPGIHEQEDGHRGQAVEEAIKDGLGLAVDPVEVLEDQDQRLHRLSRRRSALMVWRVRRRRSGGSRAEGARRARLGHYPRTWVDRSNLTSQSLHLCGERSG